MATPSQAVTADLLLDGLAAARLVQLAVADKITDRPRAALVAAAERHAAGPVAEHVEYLTGCPWCVGLYVGLGVTLVRNTAAWRWARYPLAMGCIAGIIGSVA